MSNQHQITHDNHIVPQFYLRSWSKNENTVNCYHTVRHNEGQRKWSLPGIKNMPVWRDLYTQTIDGVEDDSIERFFGTLESNATSAIEKLRLDCDVLESEKKSLVDLAIAQMVRTPSWIAEQNEVLGNAFKAATEETVQQVFEKAKTVTFATLQRETGSLNDSLESTPFPPPPIEITIDQNRNALITELSVGQRSALYAMGRIINGDVAKTLRSYPWSLLRFPDGLELPTSDNPFTRLKKLSDGTYATNCGIGVPGTLLLMPVTPNWLLATEVGYGIVEQSKLDDQRICALIVRAIVENADLYIYSRIQDPIIELIRPSIVNPEYLRTLDKNRRMWLGT